MLFSANPSILIRKRTHRKRRSWKTFHWNREWSF